AQIPPITVIATARATAHHGGITSATMPSRTTGAGRGTGGSALGAERHRRGDLGEEVVALVVDDDEGGEVLDLDAPDRFHAQLGVLQDLDLADAVLGQPGGRAADGAEVEAAVGP